MQPAVLQRHNSSFNATSPLNIWQRKAQILGQIFILFCLYVQELSTDLGAGGFIYCLRMRVADTDAGSVDKYRGRDHCGVSRSLFRLQCIPHNAAL